MSGLHLRAAVHQRDTDLEVDLPEGEVLAVLGPNGAGKSTLLALIAGLVRPDDGLITMGDTVLTDTSSRVFVAPHARGVAMLAQEAMLFPHMTVLGNVAYAPRCAGQSRSVARATAQHWLRAVGADHLADRRPAKLSGGQAQRIAVARALAAEPRILLLDEPMSALDVAAAPAVRRLLREILRDQRRTAVMVTHDLLDALAIATTVIVVEGGRVVEAGPVREVLAAPRSAFAARLAGVNLISGVTADAGTLRTGWGDTVFGTASGLGDLPVGASAVALFAPAAVSVHLDAPHASPRNVFGVTIAEMDVGGAGVRIRGADQPDGAPGLAADVTAAAVADLDLAPGRQVYFAVKALEVSLHSAPAVARG